jgi:hypothetical protein
MNDRTELEENWKKGADRKSHIAPNIWQTTSGIPNHNLDKKWK